MTIILINLISKRPKNLLLCLKKYLDTQLTNIPVLAELIGIDSKTLHKWYKEYLSGYNREGERQIHTRCEDHQGSVIYILKHTR
jgi:hypothetical protein